jgi:hypothetical protein
MKICSPAKVKWILLKDYEVKAFISLFHRKYPKVFRGWPYNLNPALS